MLAIRGLLKCPDEYKHHKQFFIELGLQVEIQKELMLNFLHVSVAQGNEKAVVEIKKDVFKLIYPDIKSSEEELFEQAAKAFSNKDEIIKMTTVGNPLKSIPANFRNK